MRLLIALSAVAVSGVAFASSGHGPSSLIAPTFNVLLLAGIIIFLIRKKIVAFFSSKSSSIAEMLERASSKAREAQAMMKTQKEKTIGMAAEIKGLEEDASKLINEFEVKYADEIKDRMKFLKEDAEVKVQAEKKELLEELNSDLLDLVISKTKTKINSDSKLAATATQNIIEGLK